MATRWNFRDRLEPVRPLPPDNCERCLDHAARAYADGSIDLDELESRLDLALNDPSAYCKLYRLLPVPNVKHDYVLR